VVHGAHHVVLSIRKMATLSNGTRKAAVGTDLLRDDILGVSLFWQPVATAAATLEEWVRYPAPSSQNVLEDRGFRGDLVLQRTNTTIIALPGKPSFLVANYEEGAEFVATLRPLLENCMRSGSRSI
jgi:hypothetical protein